MTRIPSLRTQRTALLEACLPAPASNLPSLSALDLDAFWRRFDGTAPAHLRAGLAVATLAFTALAPVALRRPVRLEDLTPRDWETLFGAASRLPLFDDLIMLTKVVACLAYFDDDGVQDAVRDGVAP